MDSAAVLFEVAKPDGAGRYRSLLNVYVMTCFC